MVLRIFVPKSERRKPLPHHTVLKLTCDNDHGFFAAPIQKFRALGSSYDTSMSWV